MAIQINSTFFVWIFNICPVFSKAQRFSCFCCGICTWVNYIVYIEKNFCKVHVVERWIIEKWSSHLLHNRWECQQVWGSFLQFILYIVSKCKVSFIGCNIVKYHKPCFLSVFQCLHRDTPTVTQRMKIQWETYFYDILVKDFSSTFFCFMTKICFNVDPIPHVMVL